MSRLHRSRIRSSIWWGHLAWRIQDWVAPRKPGNWINLGKDVRDPGAPYLIVGRAEKNGDITIVSTHDLRTDVILLRSRWLPWLTYRFVVTTEPVRNSDRHIFWAAPRMMNAETGEELGIEQIAEKILETLFRILQGPEPWWSPSAPEKALSVEPT